MPIYLLLKLDFRFCLAALPVLAAKQVTPKTDVSIVRAMHARAYPNLSSV
jgi:hypothetical protein